MKLILQEGDSIRVNGHPYTVAEYCDSSGFLVTQEHGTRFNWRTPWLRVELGLTSWFDVDRPDSVC